MAEVINLRQARKARGRAEAAHTAEANRLKHGQSGAAKRLAKAETERTAKVLDGMKRERE